MATTIRTTKASRVIIEMDGCSDYYGGALVQGNIVCKVSLPKTVTVHASADGEQFLRFEGVNYWTNDLVTMASAGEIKGARVYEFRVIQ